MKKPTQHQIIIDHLFQIWRGTSNKDYAWVHGYELQGVRLNAGWIGSSGMRRARELAEKGTIEKREREGMVEYRHNPTHWEKEKEKLSDDILKSI